MARCKVLLPDGESHFAGGVLRALGAAGRYRAYVMATSAYTPARFSRQCGRFAVARTEGDLAESVQRWAREWAADVLLPIDEPAIGAALIARRELERVLQLPPLPNWEAFEIARDKASFAEFLRAQQLPHPPTVVLTADHWCAPSATELPYPVLYKPARSGNGIGIRRFEDAESLDAHLNREPPPPAGAVVQSFIVGSDIDCSVLCAGGRVVAHTVQRQIGARPGSFRSSGAIEFLRDEGVLRLAARIVAALGWSGVAHFDMRIDRETGQLYAIEMNPRYWGSLLGSLHASVNFADLQCRLAQGQTLPPAEGQECVYLSGSAAVRSWFRPSPVDPFEGNTCTAWGHIWSDPGPEIMEAATAFMRSW